MDRYISAKHRLITALRAAGSPLSPTALAEASGVPVTTAHGTLRRMERDGQVYRTAYGKYAEVQK